MPVKHRVELACHTGYSRMNGIGLGHDWFNFATSTGIDTLVITDCGNVDAYMDIQHEIEWRKFPIKLIMGADLWIYDDRDIKGKVIEAGRLSVLIRNEQGRNNLYKILSEGERKYKKIDEEPKIPLSILLENREGLLIGSGANEGFLFLTDKELRYATVQPNEAGPYDFDKDIYSFLDYVEIPCDNTSKETLHFLLKMADYYGVPAAVVSSPRYISEEESKAYSILRDVSWDEHKHYRSTAELLESFAFLGEDKAYELVVTNTNLIADMCEVVSGVKNLKEYPHIAHQDEILRDICEKELPEKYEEITTELRDRLDWELEAIEYTSSAFMFLQIKDVFERLGLQPFEVSSRGSVGSSLVAYLCGFSEVDPIKAKLTPYFFHGFKGNKEPDIDLNFSRSQQRNVHTAFRDAPGVGTLLKAGTFGRITERDAERMIDAYFDKHHEYFDLEKEGDIIYSLSNCIKTRGQHPGGIVIFPKGKDLNDVCPIACTGFGPLKTEITGFDYHSIDHVAYKFDALGHDSPEIIKRLYDLTGVDPRSISIDDPEVMDMFKTDGENTPACIGIPEFSTEFVQEILKETRPQCFDDLVKVISLVHGTDTWLGNAEELIRTGKASLPEILADRNDVYDGFIKYGLSEEDAYSLAEEVRKGKPCKGKSERWTNMKDTLIENGVPDWFIWSCEQIRYMFPKAHSYSYMLASWRMAWYKLHFPLEFYYVMLCVSYGTGFDTEFMAYGKEKLNNFEAFLKSDYASSSPFTRDAIKTMSVVRDFYNHGFSFAVSEKELPDYETFRINDDHTIEASSGWRRDPDSYDDVEWTLFL